MRSIYFLSLICLRSRASEHLRKGTDLNAPCRRAMRETGIKRENEEDCCSQKAASLGSCEETKIDRGSSRWGWEMCLFSQHCFGRRVEPEYEATMMIRSSYKFHHQHTKAWIINLGGSNHGGKSIDYKDAYCDVTLFFPRRKSEQPTLHQVIGNIVCRRWICDISKLILATDFWWIKLLYERLIQATAAQSP